MFNILHEIRESQKINNSELNVTGQYFYYSQITLIYSLFEGLFVIISSLWIAIIFDCNIYYTLLTLFLIWSLFAYSIFTDIIPKIIYKKPIFIIHQNFLYCTKNKIPYNLLETHVIKYKENKRIFFPYLRIQKEDRSDHFDIDTFWVKDFGKLNRSISEIKGIDGLPNRYEVLEDFYGSNETN